MSACYNEFIKRLIAYRKENGLSQEEMGKLSNLTQSHYYKIENMNNIMSYNSLVVLNQKGVSADFLITGIEQKHTVLNDILMQCNELNRANFLLMIVVCIEIGLVNNELTEGECIEIGRNEIEILRSEMEHKNHEGIWRCIRRLNDLTQEKMAKLLDIDIKTYRDIEKGKTKPNVEILASVYEKLGYPPSIILDIGEKNYLFLINEVWIKMPKELQDKIENEIKGILGFIGNIKSGN